jgi:hypothetical protein
MTSIETPQLLSLELTGLCQFSENRHYELNNKLRQAKASSAP